jgi:hypothetical protein
MIHGTRHCQHFTNSERFKSEGHDHVYSSLVDLQRILTTAVSTNLDQIWPNSLRKLQMGHFALSTEFMIQEPTNPIVHLPQTLQDCLQFRPPGFNLRNNRPIFLIFDKNSQNSKSNLINFISSHRLHLVLKTTRDFLF